MSFSLRSWWSSSRQTARRRSRFVPRLLKLEERALPSTFTVLNRNDSGPGSLRAEIAAANANPGADTIVFDNGVNGTIKLTSGELLITDSVTINGPGANKLSVSGNDAMVAASKSQKGFVHPVHDQGLDGKPRLRSRSRGRDLKRRQQPDPVRGRPVPECGLRKRHRRRPRRGPPESERHPDRHRLPDHRQSGAWRCRRVGGRDRGRRWYVHPWGQSHDHGQHDQRQLGPGRCRQHQWCYLWRGHHCQCAALVITNCTISDNRATGGDNALAVAAGGGALSLIGGATISGTTFSGNVCFGGNGGTNPFVGEAEGGAIVDFGPNGEGEATTVTISGSAFENNQAIAGNRGNSGLGNADPGVDESFGAGIFNFGGTLNVTNTSFSHNKSVGGNNGTATGTDIVEVGVAEGGAVCSEIGATATFAGCSFDDNQAIGGNGNSGSGPVVHSGSGFGAGIFSGFGGTGVGANPLTVSDTTFSGNTAEGGDNNSGTASVAGLVGAGAGGGIANYLGSTASVSGGELDHNQASGGHQNTAGGSGAVFAGLGAGGGVFNGLGNYGSSGYGAFSASVLTVSSSFIDLNQAQGNGANGVGGGSANLLSATTTVDSSYLTHNQANGDGGGAGLGGGAYNDATSTLAAHKMPGDPEPGRWLPGHRRRRLQSWDVHL